VRGGNVVILASELTHKGLWYPTILGVLVVVAGIVLFVGSVYLLLGTNLGARLGFLVTFTGLMGFLVILSLLWCTTASPLNTLKGRIPIWKVQQVVPTLEKADKDAARTIKENVKPLNTNTESSLIASVKAAVDAALITKQSIPTEEFTPEDNKFAKFEDVTKYQVLNTWVVGGSSPKFWKGEFTHTEEVAVVRFCENAEQTVTFGLPPLPPECLQGGQQGYVVLTKDLGSLRFPPFVAFVSFSILFVLGLLMLHWRERDEQEADEAKAAEGGTPVERVPAPV